MASSTLRSDLRSILATDNSVAKAYHMLDALNSRLIESYVRQGDEAPSAVDPLMFDFVAGSDALQLEVHRLHDVDETERPYDTMLDAELLRYKELIKYTLEMRQANAGNVALTGAALKRLMNMAYAPGSDNWKTALELMKNRLHRMVKIQEMTFFIADAAVLAETMQNVKVVLAMLKKNGSVTAKILSGNIPVVAGGSVQYSIQVSEKVTLSHVRYPRGTALIIATSPTDRTRVGLKGVLPHDSTLWTSTVERLDTLIFQNAPVMHRVTSDDETESDSGNDEMDDTDDDAGDNLWDRALLAAAEAKQGSPSDGV